MRQISLNLNADQVEYIEGAASMLNWTKGEVVRVLIELGKEAFEKKYFNDEKRKHPKK